MRRLKFLLRPGWLVLAVVVAGFAYLCFSVLAPWQLGKNTSTSQRNQLISDSADATPVPIDSVLPHAGPLADDNEWRLVTATGSYLPGSDVLIRLRTIEDAPAFEVLTPLRLTDGRLLMVNRGYLRPAEGGRPPQLPPAPVGDVTVTGRVLQSEGTDPSKPPIRENGYPQVYFIDAGQIGSVLGIDPVDLYLQLNANQPGALGAIPLPQLDAGPYLSYGLQWLAFGLMAPLGLAYFMRAEIRERRRARLRSDPVPGQPDPAPVPPDDDVVLPLSRRRRSAAQDSATLTATEAKLADRYGKHR